MSPKPKPEAAPKIVNPFLQGQNKKLDEAVERVLASRVDGEGRQSSPQGSDVSSAVKSMTSELDGVSVLDTMLHACVCCFDAWVHQDREMLDTAHETLETALEEFRENVPKA